MRLTSIIESELSLHPDFRQPMRRMGLFLLLLALIQFIAWLAPTIPDSKGIPHYLPLHLILETVSILVSMMVFALGWNSRSTRLAGNIVLIASIFFSVGVLDFLHTISYGGMPNFITPNDAQKHLNFWLAARLLASLGLLLIAIRPWRPLASPRTRFAIFGSLSMVVVALTLIVILDQPLLPDTFIPGQGLTPFKRNSEYLVILIHLVTAAVLWHKMCSPQNFNVVLLFGAVTTLAMSEFYFTLYTTMTGSYNVLGHLYKFIAYLFIYRALVVETIEEPYERLLVAQQRAVEQNAELRAQSQLLDSIIENIPTMIFLKRASDLRFELFNKAGERMLGYDRNDLLGKNDYDFFTPEQADQFVKTDREVLNSRAIREIPEEAISCRDGTSKILQTFKIGLFGEEDQPTHLLGISVDISERIRIEQDLRRYQDHLEEIVRDRTLDLELANASIQEEMTKLKRAEEVMLETRERLSYALEGAEAGSFSHHMSSGALFLDERARAILGIAKTNCTLADWIARIYPEDRDAAAAILGAGLAEPKTHLASEFRFVQPDHATGYLSVFSKIKYKDSGEPLNAYGIIFDISKQKEFELELRRAKESAESANRAKSVFLSNMSHELRTPLNAILGFSNMMRRDSLLNQEQHNNLEIIHRSGDHLLTLINEILEMAKIEAGQIKIAVGPFELGDLVKDISDLMGMRAREKGLWLRVERDAGLPRYLNSDEVRLRQVLINLVGNALKFTQQGGVYLRLRVNQVAEQSWLVIEVEDSGPGIEPEDQQRIFEPFVQVSEVALQQGTGLGLAITQHYLRLLGGTINVTSTLGKGSVFRVELPVEPVEGNSTAKLEQELPNNVVGLAPGQPDFRILIVEDQLDNQTLLSQLMDHAGFRVKVAENGEQAVAFFRSWSPHLIWMDWRMPVMDGLEATRLIRALPEGSKVKIVALTASALTEEREEMLAAGMDDYMSKPYRFNEIFACLKRHLGVEYTISGTPPFDQPVEVLTPAMLDPLPSELRGELRVALESLEEEQIRSILAKVKDYDLMLFELLSKLAGDFNYPVILNALENPVTG